MAIVDVKSTQYGNRDLNPPLANSPEDVGAKFRFYRFNFNQGAVPGDAASKQFLARISAGKGYVIPVLSRNKWSDFGAARTLSIGLGAYTKPDGSVQAAVTNNIDDAQAATPAGSNFLGRGAGANTDAISFNSIGEIDVVSVVAGGTIPASATLDGWICVIEQA